MESQASYTISDLAKVYKAVGWLYEQAEGYLKKGNRYG